MTHTKEARWAGSDIAKQLTFQEMERSRGFYNLRNHLTPQRLGGGWRCLPPRDGVVANSFSAAVRLRKVPPGTWGEFPRRVLGTPTGCRGSFRASVPRPPGQRPSGLVPSSPRHHGHSPGEGGCSLEECFLWSRARVSGAERAWQRESAESAPRRATSRPLGACEGHRGWACRLYHGSRRGYWV